MIRTARHQCPAPMRRAVIVAAVLALAAMHAPALATAAPAPAGSAGGGVAAPAVRARLQRGAPVQVVAMLRSGPASADRPRERARATQEQQAALEGLPGSVTVVRRFSTVPALVLRIKDLAGLDALERKPNVVRIDPDEGGGTGSLDHTVPTIKADVLHAQGITGAGVTVAVLDSGADLNHPDLVGAVVHQACFGYNNSAPGVGFCPNGSDRQVGAGAAMDDAGHGTHVTGIVTSDGIISSVGVAPGAAIVAVKVTDKCSFAGCFYAFSEIVAALDYLFAHPELSVDVVNMSLGTDAQFSGDCDTTTSFTAAGAAAVNNLVASGVTLTASAGNNGSTTQMSAPACLSNVISVGATTVTGGAVASFSNTSTTTDVLAPGENVVSDLLGFGVIAASGTSMASPTVAGCVALIRQGVPSTPGVTPASINAALKSTGVPVARGAASFPRIDCAAAATSLGAGPAYYHPLTPARILDTRTGTGAPAATLGPGASLDLQVTGRGGVPATGVSAVVINVTAIAPSAGSYLTAWPTGDIRPTVSNLNYTAGQVVPNLVIVKVGAGGKISFYNNAGSTHLAGDVAGWYTAE